MTPQRLASLACGAAMVLASATATLAQTPPGNGNTGNPGTNDPAKVQAEMMKHKTSAKLPWCTAQRTHNCRHHAKSMTKSM